MKIGRIDQKSPRPAIFKQQHATTVIAAAVAHKVHNGWVAIQRLLELGQAGWADAGQPHCLLRGLGTFHQPEPFALGIQRVWFIGR